MENKSWLRRSGEYLGFVEPRDAAVSEVREQTSGATPPPRPSTDLAVTVDQALSIGAVYRSISVIVTSVSQMDLTVFRAGREMSSVPPLVRNPNVNDTATGFVEETVFSLAAHGNAFWRTYRASAADQVTSIKVLDPDTVSVTEDADTGKVHYWVGNTELRPYQIKHLRLLRQPGKAMGLGPIQAARGEIASLLRLRRFADTWFDTSGVPIGYLTTDMVLGPEESAAFAKAWKKFLADNEGTGVLSQGLDYKHLGVKPAEAQFLEVQNAAVLNIARLFGLPTTYVLAEVGGSSSTYVNQQELNLIFLQTTLQRYATEIENAMTDLLPRGQKATFKQEQLLRMNTKLLTEVQKAQIEMGTRTPDEIRASEGLDPLPKPEQPKEAAA